MARRAPSVEARGEMGELFVLLRFEAATPDEIAFVCDAPDTVRFLLRLLDEAFGRFARSGAATTAQRCQG
jgi:hypothetical protein